MATVDEIARDIVASLATDAGAVIAAKWIDNRYKELVSRVRFRHLRNVGELLLPAVVDDGAVTATRGSVTVTPDADAKTALLTSPGTGDQEYWYIRISSAWHRIESIAATTAIITLATAFAEADVDESPYVVVKRYHPLATTARWLGDCMFTRLRLPLSVLPLETLDVLAPGRTLAGNYPRIVSQIGTDSNGYVMVEVYPPPQDSEIIHYVHWVLPTALTLSSTIPPQIDSQVLKEGATIDLMRYEMAKSIRLGNVEAAALWRNESRTQETRWEKFVRAAIRADKGVDDITMILTMFGSQRYDGYEQRTARDIVLDRWSRP